MSYFWNCDRGVLRRSPTHHPDILREAFALAAKGYHLRKSPITAYVGEIVAQVRREYRTIHKDFRHDVEATLNTFIRALDSSLQALYLRMPMRVSSFSTKE